LGYMGRDRIHQRWRQTIIGLEPDFFQPRPDVGHLSRVDAGLDHRRHERREAWSGPAAFGKEFGMDEVEAVERMPLIFDPAVHMRAADLAGMTLDRRRCVDDLQLVTVFENRHVVARNHRDNRKGCPFRLPAFGAAAGVIIGDVPLDADLARPVRTFAYQRATGKTAGALLYSIVNRWVDMNSHGPILLVFDVFILERDVDLEHDYRTDRFSLMHQIESLVDLLELENVGDHRIDLDLAVHVPVDDFRHVGAAARAAERRTLPDPAGDELERPGGDLLAGFRNAHPHRNAPAAVTGFQRLPHHR